jgi:outer membrane protein
MKRIISTLLAGLFSTFVMVLNVQAQNEPQKIGTANIEYILSNLPEIKKLEADIQVYEKQLRAQLDSKTAEYQRKLDEYQRGVESGMLLPSIKADKEKELMGLQQSIQEFERSAQEDLQSKSMSMLEPIMQKVQASIDKVAAANNYTYIITTHVDYGGTAIILYSKYKDANDISTLVLKDLGVSVSPTGSITPAATTPATAPTNTATPPAKTTAPVKK